MGRAVRGAAGLLLALLFLPLGAGVAAAHGGGAGAPGTSIPRVLAVEPAVPGLALVVIEGGTRLRLDNHTGVTVAVLPPPDSLRGQEPLVPTGSSAAWADSRLAGAPAAPPRDGTSAWLVPLLVGDQQVVVHGDRTWPAPPLAVPWWSVTVAAALGTFSLGAAAAERGRHSTAATAVAGVTVLVVGAHVLHVIGSSLVLDRPASVGVVLAAAGIGVLCWVLGGLGVALTLARHPMGPATCASAGTLAALVTVFDVAGFHSAVLTFGWAFDLDRATTVVTVGGGVGLFLTGCAVLSATAPAPLVAAKPLSGNDVA
ncbi:hypothetical protein ACQPWY_31110 [Pseudonocardia xinjiangensis]|uniref:hypothetical protein n=1 Tax=Pseudonocardia xinjiangensis TaxID=75289 RepID=UPI003D8F5FFF